MRDGPWLEVADGVAEAAAPWVCPVSVAKIAAMSGVTCGSDGGAVSCADTGRESDRLIEGLLYLVSGSVGVAVDCT